MAARKQARQPDELVRVRVGDKQTEAVRVGEIWVTPGGHEEFVRFGDAEALLKSGALVDVTET